MLLASGVPVEIEPLMAKDKGRQQSEGVRRQQGEKERQECGDGE